MTTPRILAFSGSTRRESYNTRLITLAARRAGDAGADVTLVSLADYPMPIFNQDDEKAHGQPDSVRALKALFVEHDALLISAPEYNTSITPLLKNTLDWLSRRHGDEPAMLAYRNKTAGLLSASPGRLGGVRSLVTVRSVLNTVGVLVLPEQLSIAEAATAFDETGELVNEGSRNRLVALVERLITTTVRLNARGT